MGYSEKSLLDDLEINHEENSDLITIDYVSDNPELSAFVVNTLATEFIRNYSSDVSINQNSSIGMLDSILKRKEVTMNEKNAALSSFKRNKGVLNLSEQSASVYAQITQYEAQRADAIRQIQSNQGAISTIDAKLKGSDTFINGSTRADNRELVRLKNELQAANSAFLDNGFRASDQKKIDSLNKIIVSKSNQNADENVVDPRTSKASLIATRTNLEISMQSAKSSISSIDDQLSMLRAKYSSMVPYDADIQNYQREGDLATKEYMTALEQYNQNKEGQSLGLKLQIEQLGLPGNAEPSKKIFYLAGSGIGSFVLSLGVILMLQMMNASITDLRQLERATKSKAVGFLNKIESNERSIREIWNDKTEKVTFEVYRDLIRSLRFEITAQMDADDSKILGITSIGTGEGKTFLSHSLAYAF
ncbi:MAG: lipopolysaccharide biosynthesis protein, partial [Pedobacter sp.]